VCLGDVKDTASTVGKCLKKNFCFFFRQSLNLLLAPVELSPKRGLMDLVSIFVFEHAWSESGLGSHGITESWGVALSVPVQEDESPSLQVVGASSRALWM